jgi:hypothetical protein
MHELLPMMHDLTAPRINTASTNNYNSTFYYHHLLLWLLKANDDNPH